jgi:hypothetical protein
MPPTPLGKLAGHGYGIRGYCLDCRRLFAVSLTVLMMERGRDCSPIRMTPLRCPGCGRAAHAVQHHRAIEGRRVVRHHLPCHRLGHTCLWLREAAPHEAWRDSATGRS